jgi:predicted dehydrogenase
VTLRCGLVGVGYWTRSALLPALRAQADVEVVACVAGTLEEARGFAAMAAIPKAYPDLPAMLAAERLDVAVVATPDHVHARDVAALLGAGVAVYCEKPLANDSRASHELVALQQRTGVPATVGYSFRFNPAIQALRRDLAAGRFGDIWLVELAEHNPQFHPHGKKPMNWKHDPAQAAGGSLFEYGSHVIDMGAWLLGPIARVSASFKSVLPGARLDDIATLQLQFENGTTGLLISSWVLSGGFPGTRVKLHGSEAVGEVLLDDRLPSGQLYRVTPAFHAGSEEPPVAPLGERRSDAATRHIAAFIDSVAGRGGDTASLPTLAQAAHVQDVLAAALAAAERWQRVTDHSTK